MKIVAGILMMVWSIVMVQPAFAYFGGKSAYGKCSEALTQKQGCPNKVRAASSCSKRQIVQTGCNNKKCKKAPEPTGKDNCRSEGCNPSLGCSSGNFYIHLQDQILLASWIEQKQMAIVKDDKRIIRSMSECWHPPEA